MSKPRTTHTYYAVFEDHGRSGLEAIVHPEHTRRRIVEMIANGDYKNIAFIHMVSDLTVEDVTAELLGEASFDNAMSAIDEVLSPADLQAARFDHARALRNEVV